MKTKLLVGVLIALSLVGCGVSTGVNTPSEKQEVAKMVVDSEFYIRNKQGVCYSVVTSKAYGLREAISHTVVPCEKVEQNLLLDEYKK